MRKNSKRSAGVVGALTAVAIAWQVMVNEGQKAGIIPVNIDNAPAVSVPYGKIVIGGDRARLLLNVPDESCTLEMVDKLVLQLSDYILDLKREHPDATDFIEATKRYGGAVVLVQKEMVIERDRSPPK